jgi:hypothetical protein
MSFIPLNLKKKDPMTGVYFRVYVLIHFMSSFSLFYVNRLLFFWVGPLEMAGTWSLAHYVELIWQVAVTPRSKPHFFFMYLFSFLGGRGTLPSFLLASYPYLSSPVTRYMNTHSSDID